MALLVSLASTGCFASGVTPRTGQLLRSGQLAGGATIVPVTYEPGSFEPSVGSRVKGNSGKQEATGISSSYWLFGMLQGALRYGLSDRQELDLHLGGAGTGLELRQQIVSSKDGESTTAVALAVGGLWRPFIDTRRPWGRLGVDVSHEVHDTAFFLDLYATYGPESHAVEGPAQECTSFQGSCSEYGPNPSFLARTTELRLQAALGVAFRERGTGGHGTELSLSVVPYVTLWRPREESECSLCGAQSGPAMLDARGGVSLVMTLMAAPLRP